MNRELKANLCFFGALGLFLLAGELWSDHHQDVALVAGFFAWGLGRKAWELMPELPEEHYDDACSAKEIAEAFRKRWQR
jgi:hypothetical protein